MQVEAPAAVQGKGVVRVDAANPEDRPVLLECVPQAKILLRVVQEPVEAGQRAKWKKAHGEEPLSQPIIPSLAIRVPDLDSVEFSPLATGPTRPPGRVGDDPNSFLRQNGGGSFPTVSPIPDGLVPEHEKMTEGSIHFLTDDEQDRIPILPFGCSSDVVIRERYEVQALFACGLENLVDGAAPVGRDRVDVQDSDKLVRGRDRTRRVHARLQYRQSGHERDTRERETRSDETEPAQKGRHGLWDGESPGCPGPGGRGPDALERTARLMIEYSA